MNNQSPDQIEFMPQFVSVEPFQLNAGALPYIPLYYSPTILIPELVPEFDFGGCFLEILKMYPNNTLQDLFRSYLNVIYLSESSVKIILEALLPNCMESGHLLHDFIYRYCYKNPKFLPSIKGCWFDSYGRQGYGIFSFVQNIRMGSPVDAFMYVAKCLDINLSDRNVAQHGNYPGRAFVREAQAYPMDCNPTIVERFLGHRYNQYNFTTDNGWPSFCIREWYTDKGTVLLFYTLQQNDETGELVCEYIAPPVELLILHKSFIDAYGTSHVYLHDQIARAYRYLPNLQEVHTWVGDRSIFSQLDLTCLKGHSVTFVFDHKSSESVQIGAELIEKLELLGIKMTIWCHHDWENYFEAWTHEEFYNHAKMLHGLDFVPKAQDVASCVRTLNDFDGLGSPRKCLLEPSVGKGELIFILGETNAGKTFFGIDVAVTLATGSNFGDRLRATRPEVSLYIDSELPGQHLMGRVKGLLGNYGKPGLIENFKYVSLQDHRKNLDLSTQDGLDWLEKIILESNAQFVVIDSLSGVLPYGAERNDATWERIYKTLRPITLRGVSLCIVHHLAKNGDYRGSGKLLDDCDLALSVKRAGGCPKDRTIAEIGFIKARYIFGDQRAPFLVEYLTQNGETKRIVSPVVDNGETQAPCLVSQDEIDRHDLSDLQNDILTAARDSATEWVKAGQFVSDSDGRAATTVTNHLNDLCNKGLLTRTGTGSGTKYYTPEKAPISSEGPSED